MNTFKQHASESNNKAYSQGIQGVLTAYHAR